MATDLPEPDSPTTDRISPLSQTSDTLDGAEEAGRGLEFDRQIFNLEEWHLRPLQFGIERIAQAVTHQVDGKNGDEDGKTRECHHPPGARDELTGSASIVPHSGVGGWAPIAEKAEGGSIENRRREGEVA